MANEWHTEDFDLPLEKSKKFYVYKNATDEIEAKFTAWYSSDSPKEITILTKGAFDRRFVEAYYCSALNRIEIHYIFDEAFSSVPLTIKNHNSNCKVDPTLSIVLVEYEKGTTSNNFEICKKVKIDHPKHKKGSIIVGNP